jgi:hypothetical protein
MNMDTPIELKPVHPLCKLFPLMPDEDLETLAEDIKQNGLQEPIKLWKGQVIDGQNRQEACRRAGTEPRYKEIDFEDEEELRAYIISKNVERRHLTKSQQAMAYALIYPEFIQGKTTLPPGGKVVFGREVYRQARKILEKNQILAEMILAGTASLKDEYNKTQTKEPTLPPGGKVAKSRSQLQRKPKPIMDGDHQKPVHKADPPIEVKPVQPKSNFLFGIDDDVTEDDDEIETVDNQSTRIKELEQQLAKLEQDYEKLKQTKKPFYQETTKTTCSECQRLRSELETATAKIAKHFNAMRDMEQTVKDHKEYETFWKDLRKHTTDEQWEDINNIIAAGKELELESID